jgi:DNA recombination protein RmuC
MESMLSLLGGLLLGGSAGVLILRARAATEYQRGRGEAGADLARLSADLNAAARRESELLQRLDQCTDDLNDLRMQHARSQQDLATMQANLRQEQAQGEQKLALLTEAREALSNQFKALANDILEEKTKRFTEQNKENIGSLLTPLNERIQAFSKQVQDTYEKDSKERLTLEQELKNLQALNTRLNQDAVALTNALTGANNKTQGNWGEMILERVLENSGLQKDREYRVQVSDVLQGEEGNKRYQPDVIIDLPEGKQLVVDSKVSLNAYVRFSTAEDDATRALELRSHIAALRNHIKTLSEKRYQDLYHLNTLDFVFMFVPVEPAYLLAVQHDMGLFNEAFERRIMIVGPSTLMATLRTVASIWRYEYQNQNAQEIARQSGAMYDKFVGFVDSLEKLGKQVDGVRDTWQDAMKKMRDGSGNLISRAERLRKLGIKSNKQLANHLLGEADSDEDSVE